MICQCHSMNIAVRIEVFVPFDHQNFTLQIHCNKKDFELLSKGNLSRDKLL